VAIEQLDELDEVRQRAGQPVDRVNDDDIDLARPDRCSACRSVEPPQ
jgi:hypothetical protein